VLNGRAYKRARPTGRFGVDERQRRDRGCAVVRATIFAGITSLHFGAGYPVLPGTDIAEGYVGMN